MRLGDNNPPSAFIEVVTLSAWRNEYGDTGIADVFVDVAFDTGRLGGDEVPVRFQLSLKEAMVHIHRDVAEVLQLPASSVVRQDLPVANRTTTTAESFEATAGGGLTLGKKGVVPTMDVSGKVSKSGDRKTKLVEEVRTVDVTHIKTQTGWAYRIRPTGSGRLTGGGWSASEPRLTVVDPKHATRRGAPPEPWVEIRCRREDLLIENVEFKGKPPSFFTFLTPEKKATVEQYLKDELSKLGFKVGDISDPYTILVLARTMVEFEAIPPARATDANSKKR